MPIPPETFQRKQWILVDELRVVEVITAGNKINGNKWESRPDVNETIEVIMDNGWLLYRIFDSSASVIEFGAYPPDMVVSIISLP